MDTNSFIDTDFFFVYGTLKEEGYFATEFDEFRMGSEKAVVHNTALYDLGNFPCLVPGDSIVSGEVHEYSYPDTVLDRMDLIEGYRENDDSSLYIRKRMEVVTESGKRLIAFVYLFNQELGKDAKLIEDGVWKEDCI